MCWGSFLIGLVAACVLVVALLVVVELVDPTVRPGEEP